MIKFPRGYLAGPQQFCRVPFRSRGVYQTLAIVQASADRHADTKSVPLKWEKSDNRWALGEHRDAGTSAESIDGDSELRAQKWTRQGCRLVLHGMPRGYLS